MKRHIRWMIRSDVPAVLAIEWASFEYPWDEANLLANLRQRNCIAMVCVEDDEQEREEIQGFMVYELESRRLNLLDFAVAPWRRREGIGRAMIEKLVLKLSPDRRTRITCMVRETNLGGQQFFKACGFVATEIKRQPFDECNDDAIVFERRLLKTSKKQRQ